MYILLNTFPLPTVGKVDDLFLFISEYQTYEVH